MATNVKLLAGIESHVNTVPLEKGKVLFAVDPEVTGRYTGYIYYDFYDEVQKKVVRVSMGNGNGGSGNLPTLNISDYIGHIGPDVAIANLNKATIQLPDIIQAKQFIAADIFSLDDLATMNTVQSRQYGNALVMLDPASFYKQGWVRTLTGNSNTTTLEIAMSDTLDLNNDSNQIVARLYDKDGAITKEAILLDFDGSSTFPGPVKSELFIGDLQGNADTATNATNDEAGHNIQSNYLTDVVTHVSNMEEYSINAIAGDNNIKNTLILPNASPEHAGLITAMEQTLSGAKIIDEDGSLEIQKTNGFNYSGISHSDDIYDTPVWFSLSVERGIPVTDDTFTYNANANLLKVTNISGDYEILPNIFGAYIEGLVTHAINDEYGNHLVEKYIVNIGDSLSTLYVNNKGVNYSIGGFNASGGEIATVQIPNASDEIAGLVTNEDQTFKGWKTLKGYIVFPWLSKGYESPFGVGLTYGEDFDPHQTGLLGHMGSGSGTWMISGRSTTDGVDCLEIGTGHTGEQPIYFTQYKADSSGVSVLDRILTLMDQKGGTVAQRLTLTTDATVVNADTEYGLSVEEETFLKETLYTGNDIRLQAADKGSFYYIGVNENHNCQTTQYKDKPYYAFMESLLLQDQLEVVGSTYLNDTLTTRNILPDENNAYVIGIGLPEYEEERYFLDSYIRNMYSNRLIVQGPVTKHNEILVGSENPKIVFRRNEEGIISDTIDFIYTNEIPDEATYVSPLGLTLAGDIDRLWLDVHGSIYSRKDHDNFVALNSEVNNSNLLLTTCGASDEGTQANIIVDSFGARELLQYDKGVSHVLVDSSETHSYIDAYYEWGAFKTDSSIRSSMGIATLSLASKDDLTYINLESNQEPSNVIRIQTNNQIHTTFQSNEDYAFHLYNQMSTTNALEIFKNDTYAIYERITNGNDVYLEHQLKSNQYQLVGQASDDAFTKIYATIAGTGLQLQSPLGTPAQIVMNDGSGAWHITMRAAVDSLTKDLAANSLQFKKDNNDLQKIAFAYDTKTGIELYGDAPYIDFHYNSTAVDATTKIATAAPINSNALGFLQITGQVNFTDDLPAVGYTYGGGTIIVGSPGGKHLAIDTDDIMAKASGTTTADLWLNRDGGRVHIGEGGLNINGDSPKTHHLYVGGNAIINGFLEIADYLTIGGDITAGGNATFGKRLRVGESSYLGGEVVVKGNILPEDDLEYSLGNPTHRWNQVHGSIFQGDYFYGDLKGKADSADLAYKLEYPLTIELNKNKYVYNASAPMRVNFYAPQEGGSKGDVVFWDTTGPSWADPDWVAKKEDETDGKYLPLAGGDMTGRIYFASGKRNIMGVGSFFWDDDQRGAFCIQGNGNNDIDTRLILRTSSGADYIADVNILVLSNVQDTSTLKGKIIEPRLGIDREICLMENRPGAQLRFLSSTKEYAAFFKTDAKNLYLNITQQHQAYDSSSNNTKPFQLELDTGIIRCGVGLYGALWNDYAEFRESKELEPGRCVYEVGDDSLARTTERLMPGGNIISDTFGFAQGQTDKAQTPIATAGRVLAYTYEDRNEFKPGDAVCTGPDGTVSLMTREEIREWPDRIVGTVSCVPDYEEWGDTPIKVNGRIWIKVR